MVVAPYSLCAQVLGAKYYRHGDLLNAKEGPGISYTWRSIVRGIKALKEGMVWRVSDGNMVNIWLHPWIPRDVTRKLITPKRQTLVTHVCELIDTVMGGWDQAMIRDIFLS
jgi:hypothetical protein